MSQFANSQDLVALKEIRDNTLILKDGSFRQVIMVSGVNFSLKSEEEQNVITTSYQNFLNSVDFSIQIVVHSRKINIEKYLSDLEVRAEEEVSPLLQNQIREYKTFIQEFIQGNAIMEKTFLVIIPWHPVALPSGGSGNPLSFLPFFKKDKAAEEKVKTEQEHSFEESLGQLKQRVEQIISGLNAIGLETVVLSNEELIELCYNLYNPGTTEKKDISIPQEEAGQAGPEQKTT